MLTKFISYLKSPIGQIKISADENSINSILFVFENTEMETKNCNSIIEKCKTQLNEYFAGERIEFDISIKQNGTKFQQKVWLELAKIPFGKTVTYNYIAKKVGGKNMMRAVGSANGKNQISIIVPCHRVIGSDGSLTGYAGGMWRKEWLLKHEDKFSNEERQLGFF